MVDYKKRDELILKYLPLAQKLAKQRKRKIHGMISLDDLESAAYLGLIDAATKFDESKISHYTSDPFLSYASRRISGQITDYLRSCVFGSRKAPIQVHSIYNTMMYDGEGGNELLSMLIPSDEDVDVTDRILFDKLTRFFPSKVKSIFRLHFLEKKTMRQVGLEIKFSESRVCQIISYYLMILRIIYENKKSQLFEEAKL